MLHVHLFAERHPCAVAECTDLQPASSQVPVLHVPLYDAGTALALAAASVLGFGSLPTCPDRRSDA
eukprot:scaffold285_cov330-Pavlova_lutheri.AAC.45